MPGVATCSVVPDAIKQTAGDSLDNPVEPGDRNRWEGDCITPPNPLCNLDLTGQTHLWNPYLIHFPRQKGAWGPSANPMVSVTLHYEPTAAGSPPYHSPQPPLPVNELFEGEWLTVTFVSCMQQLENSYGKTKAKAKLFRAGSRREMKTLLLFFHTRRMIKEDLSSHPSGCCLDFPATLQ